MTVPVVREVGGKQQDAGRFSSAGLRALGLDNPRGFTLVELLIACAVLALMLAGVFAVQQAGLTSYQFGTQRVDAQQATRNAIDLMTGELRDAGFAQPSGNVVALSQAGATGFTLHRTDEDGVSEQRIQYVVTNNADGVTQTITRQVQAPPAKVDANPVVLASNVANLGLSYLDATGAPTAVPGDIRAVAINMSLVVTGHGTERTYAGMASRVAFRNFP